MNTKQIDIHIAIMGFTVRQCDHRTVTDEPGVYRTRINDGKTDITLTILSKA